MNSKQWLDLNEFGVRVVVSNETEQRKRVGLVILDNPALLESSTGITQQQFLEKATLNGLIFIESEYSESPLTLLIHPDSGGVKPSLLQKIIPQISQNNLKNMQESEIYVQYNQNQINLNNWVNLISQGRLHTNTVYVDTSKPVLPSSLVKAFLEHDKNKKSEMFFEHSEADALPLMQLDKYGYKADKSLITYYPTKEIALAAGVDLKAIQEIELPKTSFPIKSNNSGEILAFRDMAQIPELLNYKVDDHPGWQAIYNLPNAVNLHHKALEYFSKELKTINDELSDLTDQNVSKLLNQLAMVDIYVNKVLYEKYPELKFDQSGNERIGLTKTDNQFKIQRTMCSSNNLWEVIEESNVDRIKLSAFLDNLYSRMSEIQAPVNDLRINLNADFRNTANNITVAYSNLETALEAKIANSNGLVVQDAIMLDDALSKGQHTAQVEDIQDIASSILSGSVTHEEELKLPEGIKTSVPDGNDLAPDNISPDVLLVNDPPLLLSDLHRLHQHIQLQAIPEIVKTIEKSKSERNIVLNARQTAIATNMLGELGLKPENIQGLSQTINLVHPTTEMTFSQGRLHILEADISSKVSYLSYLNDLSKQIVEFKQDYIKPEFLDNILLHKQLTENEIETGYEVEKTAVKNNFNKQTFGFGNFIHSNTDLVKFVQRVEANTITRLNLAKDAEIPLSSFDDIQPSELLGKRELNFNSAMLDNKNTFIADFIIQDKLKTLVLSLVDDGLALRKTQQNEAPNNSIVRKGIFNSLNLIANEIKNIKKVSGIDISPMLTDSYSAQQFLSSQGNESLNNGNKGYLGIFDSSNIRAHVAKSIIEKTAGPIINYDLTLKEPTFDHEQFKLDASQAQIAIHNDLENYYRYASTDTMAQSKAAYYLQNYVKSLDFDDYDSGRNHSWVLNASHHAKPFEISRLLTTDIDFENQIKIDAKNLRDAVAQGFHTFNRAKLYVDLGFSADTINHIEKFLVQLNDPNVYDSELTENIFKSIDEEMPNFLKYGPITRNDLDIDFDNLSVFLKTNEFVNHTFKNVLDLETTLNTLSTIHVSNHKLKNLTPFTNDLNEVPEFIAKSLNADRSLSIMFEYLQPTDREKRYTVSPNQESLSQATHDFVNTSISQFKQFFSEVNSGEITSRQNLSLLTNSNGSTPYIRILPSDIVENIQNLASNDQASETRGISNNLDNAWKIITHTPRLGYYNDIQSMSFNQLKDTVKSELIARDLIKENITNNLKSNEQADAEQLESINKQFYRSPNSSLPISVAAKVSISDLDYPLLQLSEPFESVRPLQSSLSNGFNPLETAFANRLHAMPKQLLLDLVDRSLEKLDLANKSSLKDKTPDDYKFSRTELFVYISEPKGNDHGSIYTLPEFVKAPDDSKAVLGYDLASFDGLKSLRDHITAAISNNTQDARIHSIDELAKDILSKGSLDIYKEKILNPKAPNYSKYAQKININEVLFKHTEDFKKEKIHTIDGLESFLLKDLQKQINDQGNINHKDVIRVSGNDYLVGRYLLIDKDVLTVDYEQSDKPNLSIAHLQRTDATTFLSRLDNKEIGDVAKYAGPFATSSMMNNVIDSVYTNGFTIDVQRVHQLPIMQSNILNRILNKAFETQSKAMEPNATDRYKAKFNGNIGPDTIKEVLLRPIHACLAYKPATNTEHAHISFLPVNADANKHKRDEGYVLLSLPGEKNSFNSIIKKIGILSQNSNANLKVIAEDCNLGAELVEQSQAKSVINAVTNQENISPPSAAFTPAKIDLPVSSSNEESEKILPSPRKPTNDVIEDTGLKIPGARKDLFGVTLTVAQIEAMTQAQIEQLMRLDKLWKKNPAADAKLEGVSVQAYLFGEALRKLMPSSPKFPTEITTHVDVIKRVGVVYNQVVTDVRNAVQDSKSVPEIRNKLADVFSAWTANEEFQKDVQRNFRDVFDIVQKLDKEESIFKLSKAMVASNNFVIDEKQTRESVNYLSRFTQQSTYALSKQYRAQFNQMFKDRLPQGFKYSEHLDRNRYLSHDVTPEVESIFYNALNPKYETDITIKKKEDSQALKERRAILEDIRSILKDLNSETIKEASQSTQMPTIDDAKLMVNDYSDRKGRNVSAEELQLRFGFKATEFGNYLNQNDRQEAINYAYDGCAALAKMLNVKDRMIGFDGLLALANGSRGIKNSLAHYEREFRVINLTKKRGFGSFAHEWFHSLDNTLMDVELSRNPKLNVTGYERAYMLSSAITYKKINDTISSEASQLMTKLVRNLRHPDYSNTDINGVIKNLEEKKENLDLKLDNLVRRLAFYSPEYSQAMKEQIDTVSAVADDNRAKAIASHPELAKDIEEIPIADFKRYSPKFESLIDQMKGEVSGDMYATFIDVSCQKGLENLKEQMDNPGTKENLKVIQAFHDTKDSHLAKEEIPNLFKSINILKTTIGMLSEMEKSNPELMSQMPDGNGKGVGQKLLDYLLPRYTILNSTVFHHDALSLDRLRGGKKPYYALITEEFARAGEAITIECQKAKNMGNNDWLVRRDLQDSNELGAGQIRIYNSRPMGTERSQIVDSFNNFIADAMEHIHKHIPQMRYKDHLHYLRHELVEVQNLAVPNPERVEDLKSKIEEIQSLSPEQFNEKWEKDYATFVEANPERKKAYEQNLQKVDNDLAI